MCEPLMTARKSGRNPPNIEVIDAYTSTESQKAFIALSECVK